MSSIHETAPNPQFVREPWIDLTGTWKFQYDDENAGLEAGWWRSDFGEKSLEILVPYPPESRLSGIADPSFHPIIWYQRALPDIPTDVPERTLLRFGAVDYEATVWINDICVGGHIGGSSPFVVELSTDWLRSLNRPRLTLRVFDDPTDLEQPRGKQAWTEEPAGIWYKRTTGIWQPVWLEFAPPVHVQHIRWTFHPESTSLRFDLELSRSPLNPMNVTLAVCSPGGKVSSTSILMEERLASGSLDLVGLQQNGSVNHLLWRPESPLLLPTRISVSSGDTVDGYLGLRTISVDKTGFRINNQPLWLRMVLSQGYFPESHYAAPTLDAIHREVELTLALGFNGARTHQKAEDPRYLYWADSLGLLIWGEIGAAYTWSDRAFNRLSNEWQELIRRDINHPSVIAWVPFNESWGVSDVATNLQQQNAVRSIYSHTNALDGTRPVIGNDGWEHVSTDVFSLHDYIWEGNELSSRYSSGKCNDDIANTFAVAGKKAVAAEECVLEHLPIMVTEYGGVSFAPSEDESWYGYGKVNTSEEFEAKYFELTSALQDSSELAGICYTQLTDTEQETNGLLTEYREPKIDLESLSVITRGNKT
jgi:beta-galactosidase/beta-glucuronidase